MIRNHLDALPMCVQVVADVMIVSEVVLTIMIDFGSVWRQSSSSILLVQVVMNSRV